MMLQCSTLISGWISSRLGWGILFPFPDLNLEIHMLRCANAGSERGKGREERRERGLAYGADSEPTD